MANPKATGSTVVTPRVGAFMGTEFLPPKNPIQDGSLAPTGRNQISLPPWNDLKGEGHEAWQDKVQAPWASQTQ